MGSNVKDSGVRWRLLSGKTEKTFSRSDLVNAVVEILDAGSGRIGNGEVVLYSLRALEPAPFKLGKLPKLPAVVATNARLGHLVHDGLYQLKADKRLLEADGEAQ